MINSKCLNKKTIVLAITIFAFIAIIAFQVYSHRPVNTYGMDVYIAGNESKSRGNGYKLTARLWINGKSAYLEMLEQVNSIANDITEYNGDIYIAGWYGAYACYWKNGKLHIVDSGMAQKILVNGNIIHLAGTSGKEAVYWKISHGKTDRVYLKNLTYVDALIVDDNKTYIGGYYDATYFPSWGSTFPVAQLWIIEGDKTVAFDVIDGLQSENYNYEYNSLLGLPAGNVPIERRSRINDIKIVNEKLYITGTSYGNPMGSWVNSIGYWVYDGFKLLEYKKFAERIESNVVIELIQTTDDGVIIKKDRIGEQDKFFSNTIEEYIFFDWNGQETPLPYSGDTFMWHDNNTYVVGNDRESTFFGLEYRGYFLVNDRKITFSTDQETKAALIKMSGSETE